MSTNQLHVMLHYKHMFQCGKTLAGPRRVNHLVESVAAAANGLASDPASTLDLSS